MKIKVAVSIFFLGIGLANSAEINYDETSHHYSSDYIGFGNNIETKGNLTPQINANDPASNFCMFGLYPVQSNLCLSIYGVFTERKGPLSFYGPVLNQPWGNNYNDEYYMTPFTAYGETWEDWYIEHMAFDADNQEKYQQNSNLHHRMATTITTMHKHRQMINQFDDSMTHSNPFGIYGPLGWAGPMGTFGFAGFTGPRADTTYMGDCGQHHDFNNQLIDAYDISDLDESWGVENYNEVAFTEYYQEETQWVLCDYNDLKVEKILNTSVIVEGRLYDTILKETEKEDTYQFYTDITEYVTIMVIPQNSNFNNNPATQDFDLTIMNADNEVVAKADRGIGSGAVFIQLAIPGTKESPIDFSVKVSSPRISPSKPGYLLYVTGSGENDGPLHYPVNGFINGDHIRPNLASW